MSIAISLSLYTAYAIVIIFGRVYLSCCEKEMIKSMKVGWSIDDTLKYSVKRLRAIKTHIS